ncbi:MAG: prepilin-type N-terminal cleavage/methylation domain-containing protein [Methylophilus sp.]|nr:prepilin-type N-terminal cleavage/methylation domain-containing protein [Methylophilus sp.]
MFKHKSIMKQKGFTLLELLVVITLLAILAVGGLVAYDGVADNAETAAAAYNAGTLDRAVRQYRAVTNAYPDQWDNLSKPLVAEAVGSAAGAGGSDSTDNDQFLPLATRQLFGSYNLNTSPLSAAVLNVITNQWRMEEVQHVTSAFDGSVAPGKFHNEGSGFSLESEWAAGPDGLGTLYNFISVLVTANGDTGNICQVGSQTLAAWEPTGISNADRALRQNAINDAMGISRCHFVIALGFGGDAASSTSRSSVSIPAAPTYSSPNVNVANNYGRYIGLFHMGRTDSGVDNVTELFPRPKLIGFVDTEGKPVDVNIAASRSDAS